MNMIGIARRNWALRLSVVLNVCVLLYVCAHFGSSGPWIEEPPTNWGTPLSEAFGAPENFNGTQRQSSSSSSSSGYSASPLFSNLKLVKQSVKESLENKPATVLNSTSINSATRIEEGPFSTQKVQDHSQTRSNGTDGASSPAMTLKDAIPCNDKSSEPKTAQRGDYWVLYNYVPMSMSVRCWETVTYTTQADYTFLDNVEPLLERWRAPISIAMHAPGSDFPSTIEAIKYLRSCGSPLISQLVTFHIYFSSKHVPKAVPSTEKIISDTYNCSLGPPWVNVSVAKMYKTEKKLLYPVNVGRNIARESAPTYYVFASDIELYPSPNLAPKFLEMIRKRDQLTLYKSNPKVFVLSIFEVDEKSQPPVNKTQLIQMLKAGTAIPFHKKLCSGCHNVPRSKEWQEAVETEGLHVFHVGKRTGSFVHWEPIFIGTNNDPLYDERLSWEGKSDKMTQGYALCVLDYDFLILDNAFLVHRPGIKIFKKDSYRDMLTSKTNALIKKIIFPELKVLYGTRKGCAV
ncbi:beta-1,4-glucuronyltransferase 1 [Cephus cinctus]|uniref:Beta-1,4-glucuronyltransferase 1 n=1 Tax=Cephus cinctus TaxID=211228 RepID=A0AAJ7C242_CEPCN|nr:beta-1,4-glucuronyltransferase 1 [Cephus cinctus]XP_015600176.1 beta-1,4-glucuronyltransferase 1 [Cephus cinctus]XP_015600178.1 beta-1,4-glucuronyltransferase 1 [Cephus cinctus]XP_015600179.1 beta-1,4-glucuronyltransferase 1 [Cephus cinctus]XP_015600180.1 beta-1,4-glucuronyltransferase 1 [Cephus cinctus]XP_024943299.1 beta-1,4-glucuronyltransferase 1 [Cephus cinctus]